ncbi:MAG: hypothetical protein Unbinned2299contig1000_71 [Prokaryotic dsDNA virus sp.]|nr:MAG: hypothetical protein Unbinned2299contig1000_71 [Prokaryotic dsDNA virus sp.]
MALGRTAKYYRDNPEAREKRLAYQRDYNKKNVKYRQRLNKFNRQKGTYGNGDGLDACHKEVKGKIKIVLCRMKKNRADKKQRKQQSNG